MRFWQLGYGVYAKHGRWREANQEYWKVLRHGSYRDLRMLKNVLLICLSVDHKSVCMTNGRWVSHRQQRVKYNWH